MSFDKFRYQKEREEKKQRIAQKAKELKQIRISPRAAANDLETKARQAEKFLNEGHKVEILIFLRGREKGNREWNLQKLHDFVKMIKVPYQVTMEAKPGGGGFVTQIAKK
jgi:translation initiation factor IF-3